MGTSKTGSVVPVISRTDGLRGVTEGVAVLVDKPKHWSSFRVVSWLRRHTGIKKIGHAGTLDPMATGLLICCVGRSATREIDSFVGLEKTYSGTMRLGQSTASYDAESAVNETKPIDGVTVAEIERAFGELTGDIHQIPPMYSAIQIDGKRLYKLAREGVTIERPPRLVRVSRFALTAYNPPDARFEVICSKGTYIRSLAHDVGHILGVGAHLVALRRDAIGEYRVEDALEVDSEDQR